MQSTCASANNFIAAAIDQTENKQKAILKLEKKLREIEKIEAKIAADERVDPLQREKVAKKSALLSQIQELETTNEPVEYCVSISAAPEKVVFDAAKKLRSLSEEVQAHSDAITADTECQSHDTTVAGSVNSGTSTPTQEGNSESEVCPSTLPVGTDQINGEASAPALPARWRIATDEINGEASAPALPARWSDDAILDDASVFDDDFQLEPAVSPSTRSRTWSENAKDRNSGSWRRVSKESEHRRVNSYASKVFSCLDINGDGLLSSEELRAFAQATGFDEDEEEGSWDKLYEDVCMGSQLDGLAFHDFSQLFKGLMADEQFRDQISQVYPESSLRQYGRQYNQRGNRSRFTKVNLDPSLMTFEEVQNCTYEEMVRWCWQQGGYAALQYYLGPQSSSNQECSYDSSGQPTYYC